MPTPPARYGVATPIFGRSKSRLRFDPSAFNSAYRWLTSHSRLKLPHSGQRTPTPMPEVAAEPSETYGVISTPAWDRPAGAASCACAAAAVNHPHPITAIRMWRFVISTPWLALADVRCYDDGPRRMVCEAQSVATRLNCAVQARAHSAPPPPACQLVW